MAKTAKNKLHHKESSNLYGFCYDSSSWGKISILCNDKGIVAIGMETQPVEEKLWQRAYLLNDIEKGELKETLECPRNLCERVKNWLTTLESGRNPGEILPVDYKGTEFQKQVWQVIARIPYGEYITYKDIAISIYGPNPSSLSYRAIGNAVGKNPIPLMIPCHRVLGSNGNLGGYAGGIDVKLDLLRREGVDVSKFKYRD